MDDNPEVDPPAQLDDVPEGEPGDGDESGHPQGPEGSTSEGSPGDEMSALSEFMQQRGLTPGNMVYLYDQHQANVAAGNASAATKKDTPPGDPAPNFMGDLADADYITGKDLRAALSAQEQHLTAKARAETVQQSHARIAKESNLSATQAFIYESAVDRILENTPTMSVDEAYQYAMKEMGHGGAAAAGNSNSRQQLGRAARGAAAPPVSVPGRSTPGPARSYKDSTADIDSEDFYSAFKEEFQPD